MSRLKSTLTLPIAVFFLAACERPEPPEPLEPAVEEILPHEHITTGTDPHSFARFEDIRVHHIELDLDADFGREQLSGHVILHLERINPDAGRLVLDTRDLDIRDVNAVAGEGGLEPLSWRLGDDYGYLGTPLLIALPGDVEQVRVDYATAPEAFGLQWLDGQQTASGRPFLFSQSQPHHGRSWVPLQDTPAVRYTFQAVVRSPPQLMVVMGAAGNEFERRPDGQYHFEMPEPIPSYLMAIAIGDLAFAETGPRTGVYAEPQLIEAAAKEFAVLEEMVEIGEALYGPYRWDRYDLLVLPPSFPYGGMENPRLSFVTPTIIAGDGSLLTLVAHELAHSWSGNLVTNAAWRDLWLNEGFTVYFEARIMEDLYGRERRDMEAVLGYQGLMAELEDADPRDRQLVLDLGDRNPDRAFTRVPYDMGRLFLDWLEVRFGREKFDAFLREYFEHFAFQSITTEDFRAFLQINLVHAHPDRVTMAEIDEWLYVSGLPDFAVIPDSDAIERVDEWREHWLAGEIGLDELPADDWNVHEWRQFLIGLEGRLDAETMAAMDEAFNLTTSENYEILFLWLMRSVEAEYQAGIDRLERFLLEVGRNKFIRPLYAALAESDWGRDWAIEVYERARPGYHALTRQAAELALEIEAGE